MAKKVEKIGKKIKDELPCVSALQFAGVRGTADLTQEFHAPT